MQDKYKGAGLRLRHAVVRLVVVDASVVVKWHVQERGSSEAAAVLERAGELLAPDLLVAEFGNVLWKKVRAGEFSAAEAGAVAAVFLAAQPIRLYPSTGLLPRALDVATCFGQPVFDALYLALAVAEDCQLLTADEQLARALRGTELELHVALLVEA